MPANQAAQFKPFEIFEPVAGAFDELQAIVDVLNDATGGSMLKVLQNLAKPSLHGGASHFRENSAKRDAPEGRCPRKHTQNKLELELLIYLASRMKWDQPEDGQYLNISKRYLFKNLDLLGSNISRNNQIFWRTVEELSSEGYILGAQELPGKKKLARL